MTRRVSPCLILTATRAGRQSEILLRLGNVGTRILHVISSRMSAKKPRLHARAWPRLEAALISSLLSFLPFSLPFFPSWLSSSQLSSPPFFVFFSLLSFRQ